MKRNNFSTIFLFFQIYTTVLIIGTSYRLILFFLEFKRLGDARTIEILQSFVMGIRFDIVIASYILILPFIILTILSLFTNKGIFVKKIIFYFLNIFFSISFMISAADIPYFGQFFSRFSISAFQWMDTPGFVFKMIIQEPRYWLYIFLFLTSTIIFYFLLKRIFKKEKFFLRHTNPYIKIFFTVLTLIIMFIGIRGRIEKKSPIRVGTAYFCNNSFLNQLGLNPNFTLMRSYLDSKNKNNNSIALMDDMDAIANLQSYLKIQKPYNQNPISRSISFDSINQPKHNIVIVLMESMSAAKMNRHGSTFNLTPFLDSLSNVSYYFENCYTAGIHTYNGIFSTLFSYPGVFCQHNMKNTYIKTYPGIASTLKENGYSTVYFTTHDGQFDNVEGFLKQNQFERVVELKDYPADQVKTTLGVPDDYMFEHSISILNQLNKKGKPFLSVFMTASDHGPFYIPKYFTPHNQDIRKQIVEYADFSLKKFITLAKQQEWFDNTIFVFVADHGAPLSSLYDISLEYNHSPLIFFAPKIIKGEKIFSKMAGQIDIFPSIMGLLKLPYINSTMGINLFKDERPYIFFTTDDKYGVINNEWFLIGRMDESVSLLKYRSLDKNNYAKDYPEIVSAMRTYAKSHMQSFQYLNNKVIR